MKPIIEYYLKVLELIETDVPGVATGTYPAHAIEVDLITLARKSNESKNPISWKGARDTNVLSRLLRAINDGESLNDEEWEEVRFDFVMSAFKDLSPLRDPRAMETFDEIRKVAVMNDGETLLWGRKITKRDDGTAVVVLHVSDFEAFEKMLEGQTGQGDLEEGFMVYR